MHCEREIPNQEMMMIEQRERDSKAYYLWTLQILPISLSQDRIPGLHLRIPGKLALMNWSWNPLFAKMMFINAAFQLERLQPRVVNSPEIVGK